MTLIDGEGRDRGVVTDTYEGGAAASCWPSNASTAKSSSSPSPPTSARRSTWRPNEWSSRCPKGSTTSIRSANSTSASAIGARKRPLIRLRHLLPSHEGEKANWPHTSRETNLGRLLTHRCLIAMGRRCRRRMRGTLAMHILPPVTINPPMTLRIDFITIFPGMIEPLLGEGVIARGVKKGLLDVRGVGSARLRYRSPPLHGRRGVWRRSRNGHAGGAGVSRGRSGRRPDIWS